MKIIYTKKIIKDAKNIKNKILQESLTKFILKLEEENNIETFSNIKKLIWFTNFYRARFWDYRLGFRYEEWKIILWRFLHRKDIYKHYP